MTGQHRVSIDPVNVIGLGLLLMPLLTMWHEIGGHAASCVALGGRPATIGAFYVDCQGLVGLQQRIVACAGVSVDSVLALIAWRSWRVARGGLTRLILFYIMVTKAFVAAGYFLFSGFSGVGDLGPLPGGGLHDIGHPWVWRATWIAVGGLIYWRLVMGAIHALNAMIGDTANTAPARRTIAHLYYATIGVCAVLVGLLNPVGWFITIMSAAASSFGGNAGFVSIGFAVPHGVDEKSFVVSRSWPILALGVVAAIAFGWVLGPR